jgi:hypothetical protein
VDLAVEPALVRNVHADVLHPDGIERIIGERQVEGAAFVHLDPVVEARQPVQQSRAGAVVPRILDAVDATAKLGGEQAGGTREPCPDVEYAICGPHLREFHQVARCAQSTRVEMVKRPQFRGRQALLGIQARGAEGRKDSCLDVAGRIMRFQAIHKMPSRANG